MKNKFMEDLTESNMEATRKAFSAVRTFPVRENTIKVQRRMNLEAVK